MQKRKRGAQPSNLNAFKHGLYSRALTAAQRSALHDARELEPADLTEEIALLRARISALLETDPRRFDLLVAGLRTLAHLVATRHRLSPAATENLADAVAHVIEGVGAILQNE